MTVFSGALNDIPPKPGPGYTWDAATRSWKPPITGPSSAGGVLPTRDDLAPLAPYDTPDARGRPPSPGPGWTWDEASRQWIRPLGGSNTGELAPAGTTVTSGPGAGIIAGGPPVVPLDNLNKPGLTPEQLELQRREADAEAARKLRDGLIANATNQQPGNAPWAAAPAPIVAPQVTGSVLPPAERPQAAVAAAPGAIAAPTVAGTTIAPVTNYGASTVAPTSQAQASGVQAAQIAMTPQEQFRQQQETLLRGIQATASGTAGPGVGELLAKRTTDAAISNQAALAGSVSGYSGLAAHRTAARNMANLQQQGALDAAMVRAKERTDAEQRLLTGLQAARGADVDIATSQAGLTQQAATTTATLATGVSQSNAAIAATRAMKDADLQQSAAAGNALAANELARRQAELDAQRRVTDATLGADVAKANQEAQLRTGLANAANQQQANIVGATEANKVALSAAELDLKAKLANAGFTQQALLQANDAELKANLANAGFQLTQEQLDNLRRDAATGQALQATGQVLGYNNSQGQLAAQRSALIAQIDAAQKAGDTQKVATLLTVLGTLGAATLTAVSSAPAAPAGGSTPGGAPGATPSTTGTGGSRPGYAYEDDLE